MYISKLSVKVLLFLFLAISLSCVSDDECNDEDLGVNFPIKLKLNDLSGSNHLDDSNFDISLLQIIDSNDFEREFFEDEANGQTIITFQAVSTNTISFIYDDVLKYEFGLFNVNTNVIDCEIEVLFFEAKSEGVTICECDIEDTVTVEFDI